MNEKEVIIKLKICNDKVVFVFFYCFYWVKVYNFMWFYIIFVVDVEEIV